MASENDHMAVAALAQRAVHVLREIGRITGEISALASSTVNINNTLIMNSPQIAALQSGLMRVVAKHPAVRGDILDMLRDLDERFPSQPKTIDAKMLEAVDE